MDAGYGVESSSRRSRRGDRARRAMRGTPRGGRKSSPANDQQQQPQTLRQRHPTRSGQVTESSVSVRRRGKTQGETP